MPKLSCINVFDEKIEGLYSSLLTKFSAYSQITVLHKLDDIF